MGWRMKASETGRVWKGMGLLFGILGLALADPMLAMLKVLLERQSARTEASEG